MYEEISAPLISGTLRKMHHNMLVRPLGLFEFSIVCVITWKALSGFFICIFTSLTCMKKPVFSRRFVRLYWDLLTSGRYQPACDYF